MIDRETSFVEKTISGDIDVTICYDGILLVDGREVCNIFDITRQITNQLLDEIDDLNKNQRVVLK